MESIDLAPGDEAWLLELAGLLLHTDTSDCDYDITSPRAKDKEPKVAELGDYAIDQFTIKPVSHD